MVTTGTDIVQVLPTQSHTRHLRPRPFMSLIPLDIIAAIRDTDTLRAHTRSLTTIPILILMDTVVIITEDGRPLLGTAFVNSLEWSLRTHHTITPTEIRVAVATTLSPVIKITPGGMMTDTGER